VAAFSLAELVVVVGLVATLSAAAVPATLSGLSELQALGAVRYVFGRLQQARLEAIVRGRNTALRFTRGADGFQYAAYIDGNGDGVRASDIDEHIDTPILWPERLSERFSRVEFGALAGLPAVDGSAAPGDDPVRLGASDMVSFTPFGTATSGSLYILGPGHAQYAIRVFGETAKVRILRFDVRSGRWLPQ